MVKVESWGDGRYEIEGHGIVWGSELCKELDKLNDEEEGIK